MFEEVTGGNYLYPVLLGLAYIINIAFDIYVWLIIIRALLSWVNPNPYNRLVRFIYRATEPVLAPLRRLAPLRGLGIDISPILAIAAIMLLQNLMLSLLRQLFVVIK
ncbi:MAG: YggT family protein [Smithellaceae bacterium]|nr:YggT family protein [Smithellaceae bacterium]